MSGELLQSRSPQDPEDLIGEYPTTPVAAVAELVDAAQAAQRTWWSLGAARRSAALTAAAGDLAARSDEATALIVREVGKPIAEARGEVERAVAILSYYAQQAFASIGVQLPPSLAGLLYVERRPHGVAGLITPWNFPLAIPLWKAAPALVAGNGVVLKPSPDAVACAAFLLEVLGPHLPDGLVALAIGEGAVGQAVVAVVDVVSFTGSAGVGRGVAAAATARGIPVQCEMGGQNAAIVLEDADATATAAMVASAAMGFAGQKCTATRRVIVVGDHPDFVEALGDAVWALAPADPGDPSTAVGPLVNERAYLAMRAATDLAEESGGMVLAGGGAPDRTGWFVEPTLVDGLDPGHILCTEETFGPLAVVQHAPDLASAVDMANAVRFGLVTSMHGRDLDAVLGAVGQLDTGLIKVNAPTTGVDFYAPFGGEKDSSYGPREQGSAGPEFYSSSRTVTIAPHRPS